MGSVGWEEREDTMIYEGGAKTRSERQVRRMSRRALRAQKCLSVNESWMSLYIANPWRWGRTGHEVDEKGGIKTQGEDLESSNDDVES